MARSTTKLLLPMVALTLAGGCATVPSTLRPTDPYVCGFAEGNQYAFAVCATRGQPYTLGNDHVSPNLWVSLATRNAAMSDFRDWAITVTRDGQSVLQGRLPPAPPDSSWAGHRSRVGTFVPLPGKRWVPGRYQVTLAWTLSPGNHVTMEFEVTPGAGPALEATPGSLPGSRN